MNNAVTTAWMGWELINASQDVDIKNRRIFGFKKLPLGSYVENLVNIKYSDAKKVGTVK